MNVQEAFRQIIDNLQKNYSDDLMESVSICYYVTYERLTVTLKMQNINLKDILQIVEKINNKHSINLTIIDNTLTIKINNLPYKDRTDYHYNG